MVLVSRFETARNDGQLLQDNARLIERHCTALHTGENTTPPSPGESHPRVICGGVGCVQQMKTQDRADIIGYKEQAFDVLH